MSTEKAGQLWVWQEHRGISLHWVQEGDLIKNSHGWWVQILRIERADTLNQNVVRVITEAGSIWPDPYDAFTSVTVLRRTYKGARALWFHVVQPSPTMASLQTD